MIKDVFKLLGLAVLFLLFVALFLALFFGVPALVQWCINSIAQNAHSDFRMGYWLTFACWMVLGMIGGMFQFNMTNYKKRNYLRSINYLVCLYLVPFVICRFIYDINWFYTIGITSMFVPCHIASKLGESLINDWYDNSKNSTDTPFHSNRIKL